MGNIKRFQNKKTITCESPGSFTETTQKYRNEKGFFKDVHHGISLKSDKTKSIPDWKCSSKGFNVHYGQDGTGDLCNIQNIYHLERHIGANSVDFITSDGGFNNQEMSSLRLIISEILCALLRR